jgi:hypothetical protein
MVHGLKTGTTFGDSDYLLARFACSDVSEAGKTAERDGMLRPFTFFVKVNN